MVIRLHIDSIVMILTCLFETINVLPIWLLQVLYMGMMWMVILWQHCMRSDRLVVFWLGPHSIFAGSIFEMIDYLFFDPVSWLKMQLIGVNTAI
jgi:hypothetical protein